MVTMNCDLCEARGEQLQKLRVAVNKLRDEMAATHKHAESAHCNISRAKLAEFIQTLNTLC